MARTVAIGLQDFEQIRRDHCFYIDKTKFIKEWWGSMSTVTLITRPRRFGKTLTLSMVDHFFSNRYRDQATLFESLKIWEDEEYRNLQGSYPVIFLSFADMKETNYADAFRKLCGLMCQLYRRYDFLLESDALNEAEKEAWLKIREDMDPEKDKVRLTGAVKALAGYLSRHFGRKVIVLLDEYDTPMQEAFANGYWDEVISLFRPLFNTTFKTNEYLERALLTGITRVSRESLFSDLNNLDIASVMVREYEDTFGFTEEEVFRALEEFGYRDREGIRYWYDGFTFGRAKSIYNPWSILNYLKQGELKPYWANTSSNALVSSLIRKGDRRVKQDFERLLTGHSIKSRIEEEIVFGEMQNNAASVWSLLVASGYLKILGIEEEKYEVQLTNYEVMRSFERMVRRWFGDVEASYNDFTQAMLSGNTQEMNAYMNQIVPAVCSSFDSGTHPSDMEPERFYHGFVLGLIVDLKDRYLIRSNRESGFGRYDVVLEPRNPAADDAVIIEFKVQDAGSEKELGDTVAAALAQIAERNYASDLIDRGIPAERVRSYGFAFRGKEVLIG